MDIKWIVFEGEDGLNDPFDDELNKSKKHKRDDSLVPFKTKTDKNQYIDFSGVVGAFSRLISSVAIKKGLNRDTFKTEMRKKLGNDCSDEDFEKLFSIVEDMYFDTGKPLPINTKALSYIESNISQQQVAEYLYSLFVDNTDLIDAYESMEDSEDTNLLEKLVFDSLVDSEETVTVTGHKAECFLPYVKDVFSRDYRTLTLDNNMYQSYISRFLGYYYLFYVSQLAIKLNKFESAQRDEIEKVYLTLYEEVVTRVRPGYEYGWKYVKEKIGHMFSHSVLMEMLSHNVEGKHMDYLAYFERFNNAEDDEKVASEIAAIRNKYIEWIPMDYSGCKHDLAKDGTCRTSNEIRKLFETIDYQFINGGRKSHYNGYNKKYIEFVQKNFGKFRGTCGYTLSPHESDVIMFTKIILLENGGKIRLSKLFDEFEKRGLLFDRESKKKITELFEKMSLLEKRSDSGDAQYVKYVL